MALKIYTNDKDIVYSFLRQENLVDDFEGEVALSQGMGYKEARLLIDSEIKNRKDLDTLFTDGILLELDEDGFDENEVNWKEIQEEFDFFSCEIY